MTADLDRLIHLLDVEEIEVDLYRGRNTDAGWIRVYGGQVVAQALAAAQRTVPTDRPVHSLHSYFIRPGEPRIPILYQVARERDGSSFTTRRVQAIQHGRTIFVLTASFQTVEEGLAHQDRMPAVPGPETLPSEAERDRQRRHLIPEQWREIFDRRDHPFEFRPLDAYELFQPVAMPPNQRQWFRARGEVPDNPGLKAALLAYATDMTLLDTCLRPHAVSWGDPALQAASLDHAIWFHTVPEPAHWLLYDQVSPAAAGGRGLNIGNVFDQGGRLVATVAQEGLIRIRR